MSEMIKGWKSLVQEAISKIIREEITDQLNKRFPRVNLSRENSEPGFNYAMRDYIETRYTKILAADPEIDQIIKEHLKKVLIDGFNTKSF